MSYTYAQRRLNRVLTLLDEIDERHRAHNRAVVNLCQELRGLILSPTGDEPATLKRAG